MTDLHQPPDPDPRRKPPSTEAKPQRGRGGGRQKHEEPDTMDSLSGSDWTEFFPRLTDRPLFDVRLLRSGPLLVFQFVVAPATDEGVPEAVLGDPAAEQGHVGVFVTRPEDPTWFSAEMLFPNHSAAELAALHAVPADFDRACLDALAKVRDGSSRTVCRPNREREP